MDGLALQSSDSGDLNSASRAYKTKVLLTESSRQLYWHLWDNSKLANT